MCTSSFISERRSASFESIPYQRIRKVSDLTRESSSPEAFLCIPVKQSRPSRPPLVEKGNMILYFYFPSRTKRKSGPHAKIRGPETRDQSSATLFRKTLDSAYSTEYLGSTIRYYSVVSPQDAFLRWLKSQVPTNSLGFRFVSFTALTLHHGN